MTPLSHRRTATPVFHRKDHGVGSVVSARDESVRAGMDMLRRGGNAIDAAVAAGLVAGVIEPTETTLGGCGFLVYNDGRGSSWSVEFGPRAPLAATADMFDLDAEADSSAILGLAPVEGNANVDGPRAAGVPRTLLALLTAQERFGVLARDVVMEPAIEAARTGFRSDSWFVMNALTDRSRLRADPTARATFLGADDLPRGLSAAAHYGSSVDVYGLIPQPLLARTLSRLAVGGISEMATGSIARELATTASEIGSLITLEDLADAGPQIDHPLSLRFRDCEVLVPRSPSGGLTVLQILAIWQQVFPDGSPRQDSPERTRQLALIIRHAFADRYHWLGDPDVVPVPEEGLISSEYAATIARDCSISSTVPDTGERSPWLAYAATPLHDPWPFDSKPDDRRSWRPATATTATSGTTHISVVDAQGGTVSLTHTAANHFGSGIICPRTGLLLDSAMAWFNAAPGAANSISGGARAVANMAPAVIVRDGTPVAAVGASGGRRIISAVAQTIIDLVDRNLTAAEALAMPRVDASGSRLVLPAAQAEYAASLADLRPQIVSDGVEGYAIDFARTNIAAYRGSGHTESAIDGMSYGR